MNERGVSFVKVLIFLVIFSLLGYTATKWIILKAHYQAIKEKVRETARFAGSRSDKEILKQIIRKGEKVHVILYEEDISIVRRPGQEIIIQLSYPDSIDLRFYTFRFDYNIEERAPLPR
ncbi:hypothetical protein IIA15_02515 [candidate division TA06 bacterium]|nr:hypothetical protein [candidate division TA06 bacterium]